MVTNFGTIDTLVTKTAQDLAIILKAQSVVYTSHNETWSYYCGSQIIERFTKTDITRFIKGEINKRIYFIK